MGEDLVTVWSILITGIDLPASFAALQDSSNVCNWDEFQNATCQKLKLFVKVI